MLPFSPIFACRLSAPLRWLWFVWGLEREGQKGKQKERKKKERKGNVPHYTTRESTHVPRANNANDNKLYHQNFLRLFIPTKRSWEIRSKYSSPSDLLAIYSFKRKATYIFQRNGVARFKRFLRSKKRITYSSEFAVLWRKSNDRSCNFHFFDDIT